MSRSTATKPLRRSKPGRPGQASAAPPSGSGSFMPLAFALALGSFAALSRIQSNRALMWSFAGSAAVLVAWWAVLRMRTAGRTLKIDVVLRPEHYVQTVAQLAIYLYWSLYWQPLQDHAVLIVAQVVFAYAFDMLLSWSRRDTYTMGFGPVPIVFSINLFLRFRDDVFALQFALVAVAFLAKELIRWNKDGRRVHIFNPSSFPLALASVVLLLTHSTQLTWGEDIATQLFRPPHIYLFLFLVSLPGQYRFGITTMSLSAIVTTYLFGLAYFAATGTYFFIDSYIPVAVFLGMLLLVVDPATAPRTELGRIIFGAVYGVSTVGLYAILARMGAPTFYDKLLQVPIMNLAVQAIDRAARSPKLAWLDPARVGASLAPSRRRLAYTSMWVVVFGVMSLAQGVGDHHPGHRLPFWQEACAQGRRGACDTLARIESTGCETGSGWACNELGLLMFQRRAGSPERAPGSFRRACALGVRAACLNAEIAQGGEGTPRSAPPRPADFAVVLREGKGALPDRTPFELFSRACDQGWMVGCAGAGEAHLRGGGAPRDHNLAASEFSRACAGGVATACSNLGYMYKTGDGVTSDGTKALSYLKRACELGMEQACGWLREQSSASNH